MKRVISLFLIFALLFSSSETYVLLGEMDHDSDNAEHMEVNAGNLDEMEQEEAGIKLDNNKTVVSEGNSSTHKQEKYSTENKAIEKELTEIQQENLMEDNVSTTNGDASSPAPITPFAGNLNVDIDITANQATVLAGNDAAYKLTLKVTGARTEYTNARLVVDLPITEYTRFEQSLDDIQIGGVSPTYDESTHQLIYEFDTLKAGGSYETIIKIKTENGISPDGESLVSEVTFDANEQSPISDSANVRLEASNSLTVTKRYRETRLGGEVQKAPFPNSYTIWDIRISIPKKDLGQMYLEEGSKIVVQDTFSNGLSYYDVMDNTPEPIRSGNTLTWEFDAPTVAEQMEADGDLFTIDLRVRLRVGNNNNLVGTTQSNRVNVNAKFIDGNDQTEQAEANIYIVDREESTGEISGTVYIPAFIGPSNGNGGTGTNEVKNPNPAVYDDAYLLFRHGISSFREGQNYNFREYTTEVTIDPNLIFQEIRTPGAWRYTPTTDYWEKDILLANEPEFNIVAEVNGEERVLVTNAQSAFRYTRQSLGLLPTDKVSNIKLDFTYAPAGMQARTWAEYSFTVEPGYVGRVENTFNVVGRDYRGNRFNYKEDYDGHEALAGPRHATVVPRPPNHYPIGTVSVELSDHMNSEVIPGNNRLIVSLNNTNSSPATMNKDLETVVLLPPGVTISSNPNPIYIDGGSRSSDNDISAAGGSYEVLEDNYNGSGRQLVKFTWNDSQLRINRNVQAEINVVISEDAPNTLQFDVYGFTGNTELSVPSTSGDTITDTILQVDEDDLNGDGVTDQPRLKSGNLYVIRGKYDIQTEKLVKGELDDSFTYFGHTVPNGSIDYQLKLTNTTGADITKMTLIDVLPSVGDLGITDNVDRGSQFTPKLTDSITLPEKWQDKVRISYSTAKNPMRDDLTRNTIYPESTTPLTNPENAEQPNWMLADEVSDWSTIHSFKLELMDGIEWIEGEDITIQFRMQAPSELEVNREVLDPAIEPTSRAAWNSFAVATDHGQPVEPLRVGVYMDYEIEDPTVEKTVNDQKETLELGNREENFTWKIDYAFGNYTGNWESVVLQDQIHELLEITDVKIIDQNNEDVTSYGELVINNNLVTFTLNKMEDSFTYLKDQTYTLVIESKIRSTATDEELEPYIQSNGIPNQGELLVDNDPILSNEVRVKPPVLGNILLVKVDQETRETLSGAEFELWKCRSEDDSLEECEWIGSDVSNEEGFIEFDNLPMGYYKLIETKAPEGYRLLASPIDIELINEQDRFIELEVENSSNGWELPKTGGVGTLGFYGLGIVLMLIALLLFTKRRKNKNL